MTVRSINPSEPLGYLPIERIRVPLTRSTCLEFTWLAAWSREGLQAHQKPLNVQEQILNSNPGRLPLFHICIWEEYVHLSWRDKHLNGEEALGIFPEGINYIGVFEVKSAGVSNSLEAYYVCVRCDGSVCN